MAARKPTPDNVLDKVFMVAGAGDVSRETNGVTRRIALATVTDNPYQYRQHYDPATLCELATNIKSLSFQLPATSGLQQVPVGRVMLASGEGLVQLDAGDYQRMFNLDKVLRDPTTTVQIAYGHRRLRAFTVLAQGYTAVYPTGNNAFNWPTPEPEEYGTLPVQLMYLDDQAMAEFALTENSQRDSVSAIEEAGLLQRMIDEFGLTLEDAGRRFGWDRTTVSNKLRLLRLPAKVRMWVMNGDLSEKHGRTLLRLEGAPDKLLHVAEEARSQAWGTRKLDEQITYQIRKLPTVVAGKVTMPTEYSTMEVRQPWDLQWQPIGENVRGACEGCALRVTFGNEPGPRCADPTCHSAKQKAWRNENERRQRDAAESALTQLHGGSTLAEIFGGEERRRIPLLEKVHTWQSKERVFDLGNEADKVLVESELCGPECSCFAACYEPQQDGYYNERARWRPAPETAPEVVYCCTDPDCVKIRLDALRTTAAQRTAERHAVEEAERRAKDPEYAARQDKLQKDTEDRQRAEKENTAQAKTILADAVMGAGGPDGIWNNHAFLVELVGVTMEYVYDSQNREKHKAMSVDQLRQVLVDRILRRFMVGGRYDTEGLQNFAKRMAPPALAQSEPPTVATEHSEALPDALSSHGWTLHRGKGGQWQARVTAEGDELKTRWHGLLKDVIADAEYMDRELKVSA